MLKDFLWGFNKEAGRRRTTLVAWSRLTQPKEDGGLGFKDGESHSQALLCKWITQALDDPSTEWAQVFYSLSNAITWDQRRLLNRTGYTHEDQILLGEIKPWHNMKYFAGPCKAWFHLRRHLILNPDGVPFLGRWQIEDIISAMHPFASLDSKESKLLGETMGWLGISTIDDMWDSGSQT